MGAMTVQSVFEMSREQLQALADEQQQRYQELSARGLKLDITRGKPAPEQLDLSNELLSLPGPDGSHAADGTDVRNYGGLSGLPEIRRIYSELLAVPVDNLLAGDNSSLSIMHDTIAFAMLHGLGQGPWFGQGIKFICPSPGYDRHFAICESLGIEMITVDLTDEGIDLDQVRDLAADPLVKGLWMVPTYSNPTGYSYPEATIRALLEMPAAPDFRIWCDNAYAVHHLTADEVPAQPILQWAQEAGNPDRLFLFASTSKVSFAGAGVSFFASSGPNLTWYLTHLGKRTIGPDKVNQLRHARYLKDADGVRALMRKHRDLLAPKFAIVLDTLQDRLAGTGAASWTHPLGGYFVSLDVLDGTASRVVELAKQAGIALTPAGSSYPYGKDPNDRNIRIAPSFPSEADLAAAMDGLATCVLVAATGKLLGATL